MASLLLSSNPTVGKNVIVMVVQIIQSGIFPDNLCDSLLVVIPKVDCPEFITQFRPIALLNVGFKIASKVS